MSQNQRVKLYVITAIGLAILLPWFVLTQAQERKPKPIVGDSVGGHSSSNLKVGDRVPVFQATDQFGKERNFDNLKGNDGLVILFFKSAEW